MSIVRNSLIAVVVVALVLINVISGQGLIECEKNRDCPLLGKCTGNYLYYYQWCKNGYCVCDGPGYDINCENYCNETTGMLCHGYCTGTCGDAHCVPETCECNKLCGSECEIDEDCPSGYYCDDSTCKCVEKPSPPPPTTTIPQYHYECTGLYKCEKVPGAGIDECSKDSECIIECPGCPASCECLLGICYGYDNSRECCEDAGYWWNSEYSLCCGNDGGEKTPWECPTGKVGTEECICCGYINTPLNPYAIVNDKKIVLYNGNLDKKTVRKVIEVDRVYKIDFGVENTEPKNAVDWDTKFRYRITICSI